MRTLLRLSSLPLLFSLCAAGAPLCAQEYHMEHSENVAMEHQDAQWDVIRNHLPDVMTAAPEKLELAGDILRARRLPESALDYYNAALKRGGNESRLLNKIGVTQLELRRTELARLYFQRVVHLKVKNADAWNNLGAVEYLDRRYSNAVSDYKHAIKVDAKSATFHGNLGTAYFELNDYKDARKQFETALRLDPNMAQHDSAAGVAAHLLSPQDHAHYCFEMARIYAERGDDENTMHYLKLASEGGYDVMEAMRTEKVMESYRKDPRVLLLVQNAHALHNAPNAVAEAKTLTPLAAAATR